MIITIDGPSGTGKSTIARAVARHLGFIYFDTGAMYRSVTWMILKKKIDIDDDAKLEKALSRFRFVIKSGKEKRYFVNGKEVTKAIRSREITGAVSKVASKRVVRKNLVKIQRKFAKKQHAIFEGRDMGSVVFPGADLKVFLTARPEVRAKRRYLELIEKFPDQKKLLKEIQIREDIEKRDKIDSTRKISPLKQSRDMALVDSSDKTIEEVTKEILKLVAAIPKKKKNFLYHCFNLFFVPFFKIFYRLKVYGKSSFPPGAAIIAPNHASFYDPPVVGTASPEQIHFLARESLFKNPFFGWLIGLLNAHPVAKGAGDAAVMKQIIKLLSKGNKVLLFPEGERISKDRIGKIQPGIGFLAYRTKCAIIPVYISGTYDVWNRQRKFPKLFGKIAVVFGSPLTFDEFKDLDRKAFMEEVSTRTGDALKELKKWYQKGAIGLPP